MTNELETLLFKHPNNKMLRITAIILRFIAKCRGNKTQEPLLTSEEIQVAEIHWIKKAQESKMPESNIELKKDEKGVWRCNGRIPGYKPILIPRSHQLVKLIIQQSHKKTLHGGSINDHV